MYFVVSTAIKKLADRWVRITGCLLSDSKSWKSWALRVILETANGMGIKVLTVGYGCQEGSIQEGSNVLLSWEESAKLWLSYWPLEGAHDAQIRYGGLTVNVPSE